MMGAADWHDALKAMLPDDYQPEQTETPAGASAEGARPKPLLEICVDRKRSGKPATIISGFTPDDKDYEVLAAELRKKLACGGSARGGEILLQGDRARTVIEILTRKGYKTKRVGG